MKDSEHNDPAAKKRGIFARLRANFFTGLIAIAPVGLTLWLIWATVGLIDSWVLPFVPASYRPMAYLGLDIPGLGVLIFLVFTILVGWLAKGLIGRTVMHWGESIVARMPVVRTIYNGVKQIAETVFAQSATSFDRACLIEYPRRGIWAVAFISTSAKGEIDARIPRDERLVSVFLPTTPNPTSGFLLFLPASEVIELDMGVEDAAKLVISAGLVYPNGQPPPAVQATPPPQTRPD